MSFVVRAARPDDDRGIAEVAQSNTQSGLHSGADGSYTAHVRGRGRILVAEQRGRIVGYGATVGIGAVSMLTDLFVDERSGTDRHDHCCARVEDTAGAHTAWTGGPGRIDTTMRTKGVDPS